MYQERHVSAVENISTASYDLSNPNTVSNTVPELIYADNVQVIERGDQKWIKCENFLQKGTVVFELGAFIGRGSTASVRCARLVEVNLAGAGSMRVDSSAARSLPIQLPEEFAIKDIDVSRFRNNLEPSTLRVREKIRREVSIMAALRHPNIVTLYGALESKDGLYLVMERVTGGELFDKVNAAGPPNSDELRFILYQLVMGLEYIHSKSIIHRDLKLENILIDKELKSGYFNVRIADFGLSIFIGDFGATSFVGTPQYWAPEVRQNASMGGGLTGSGYSYGSAADIWSLGVILYVMIATKYPFEKGYTDNALIIFPEIFNLFPHLQNLVSRMLQPDPVQRITLQEILSHPFMTAPRPANAPPFPTYDRPEGTQFPVIISAGSMLGGLSQEPVIGHNIPRPIPHSNNYLTTTTTTTNHQSTNENNNNNNNNNNNKPPTTPFSNGTDNRAIVPINTNVKVGFRKSSFKGTNEGFANIGKVLNLSNAFCRGKSVMDKMDEEVNKYIVSVMSDISNNGPTLDIFQHFTNAKITDQMNERSPGEPDTPKLTAEELLQRGFHEEDLAKMIVTVMRNLQWVYLSCRNIDGVNRQTKDLINDMTKLLISTQEVLSRLSIAYDHFQMNISHLKMIISCNEFSMLDIALSCILDIKEKLEVKKKKTNLIHSEYVSLYNRLTDIASETSRIKEQRDKGAVEKYSHLVQTPSDGSNESDESEADLLSYRNDKVTHSNAMLAALRLMDKVKQSLLPVVMFWNEITIKIESILNTLSTIASIANRCSDGNKGRMTSPWLLDCLTKCEKDYVELGNVVKRYIEECVWVIPASHRLRGEVDNIKASVSTLSLYLLCGGSQGKG